MTIGKKLMICIAGMLAVVLALAGTGWYSSHSLGAELNFTTRTVGARSILGGELNAQAIALRERLRGLLLYALARDRKLSDQNRDEFREHFRGAKATIASIEPLLTTAKGREQVAAIDADLDKYNAYFEQIASLVTAGKSTAALALFRDVAAPTGARIETLCQEYGEFQKAQLAETAATGDREIGSARWMAVIFVIGGLAVVGLIAIVVRGLTAQLRDITLNLSEGAEQIASGSTQVASASQTLAQGASEQASSLEETSASAEEITSMTRQNAANTTEAAELMAAVDRRIAAGNETLGLMLESMNQINASSGKI